MKFNKDKNCKKGMDLFEFYSAKNKTIKFSKWKNFQK